MIILIGQKEFLIPLLEFYCLPQAATVCALIYLNIIEVSSIFGNKNNTLESGEFSGQIWSVRYVSL